MSNLLKDKDRLGAAAIWLAVAVVIAATSVPVTLLLHNHIVHHQHLSIWWMQSGPVVKDIRAPRIGVEGMSEGNSEKDKISELLDGNDVNQYSDNNNPKLNSNGHSKPVVVMKSKRKSRELSFKNGKASQAAVHNAWINPYESLVDYVEPFTSSAFCSDYTLFPFQTGTFESNQMYQPWIFDAVVTRDRKFVNIVLMDSDICIFNHSDWTAHSRRARQLGNSKDLAWLGNGSSSSVYAKWPRNINENKIFKADNYVRKKLSCRFYDARSQLIASTESLPITSGMLVRCPVPSQVSKFHGTKIRLMTESGDLTGLFGVCSLSKPANKNHKPQSLISSNTTGSNLRGGSRALSAVTTNNTSVPNKWKLTVCASTASQHQALLYEWIEYHRMLGVEHIFIYDRHIVKNKNNVKSWNSSWSSSRVSSSTRAVNVDMESSPDTDDSNDDDDTIKSYRDSKDSKVLENKDTSKVSEKKSKSKDSKHKNSAEDMSGIPPVSGNDDLEDILKDFVDAGIVTVVPWPYKDCSEHMWCDHSVKLPSQRNLGEHQRTWFEPPKPLQHQAAIASCYNRFNAFTEWMLVLDVHEYIGLHENHKHQNRRVDSLPGLIDEISMTHKNLAAIEFSSTSYLPCRHRHQQAAGTVPASELSAQQSQLTTNASAVRLDAYEDEENQERPPRFSSRLTPNPVDVSTLSFQGSFRTLLVNTEAVVTFKNGFVLHVEGDQFNPATGSKVRREARRGSADAKMGEYSIAEVSVDQASVLDIRSYDNPCDKALIDSQSLKEICLRTDTKAASSSQSESESVGSSGVVRNEPLPYNPYITRFYETLQKRFSSAIDGVILPPMVENG